MENENIHPVHTCPVNRCVVLFEQWGYPLVGWFCPDGSIGFPPDQYSGHTGFDSVQLRVHKKDIVGWLPLPSQPPEGNWHERISYAAETPLRGEQTLYAIRFFSNIYHLGYLLQRENLIKQWHVDENGPDGVGGRGAWRLKIQPFFAPAGPLLPHTQDFIREVERLILAQYFSFVGTQHSGDGVYLVTPVHGYYTHEFDMTLYLLLQTAISDQIALSTGFVSLIPYSFKPM
jgi:hypothetical protein